MSRGTEGGIVVAIADRLAAAAHAGQTDKAGAPYIEHPRRVAARFRDPVLRAAALLHDVLEDTPLTAADLRRAGIPPVVVNAVVVLTRRPDEPHEEAVRRAAAHPLARCVKRADIVDNADPERLALLDEAEAERLRDRYATALAILDRTT